MTTTPAPQQVVKGVGKAIMVVALEGAALLLLAERLDWPMAWVLLGGHACLILINTAVLIRLHPDLIAERSAMRRAPLPLTGGWRRWWRGWDRWPFW